MIIYICDKCHKEIEKKEIESFYVDEQQKVLYLLICRDCEHILDENKRKAQIDFFKSVLLEKQINESTTKPKGFHIF